MKRTTLYALAFLLTSAALISSSRPAYACTVNPLCYTNDDCFEQCGGGPGTCNPCSGLCSCS